MGGNENKVCLVDDDAEMRAATAQWLELSGYKVQSFPDAPTALNQLTSEFDGVVVSDIRMPRMDGMAFLARLNAFDSDIPVVLVTAHGDVQMAVEAMRQGAYDFIIKPVDTDQLNIVVNRASEKIQLVREAEKLEQKRKRTLSDLRTEKSRIHTILTSLPNGVLVTNSRGKVVLMNPAFRQILELSPDLETGNPIEDYLPDEGLCRLVMEISRGKHVDYDDIPDYEFALSDKKYLLARGQPVLGERRECLGSVINVVDISTMKVLDRHKSEFVAKVSHELRSPLATIHEQLALVIKDMVGESSKDEQHVLARAKEKTHGLISFISDLLDLSRIEEGVICSEPKPVRLDEVLKSIVDFLETRAKSKEQTLTLELPKEPLPLIMADPLALESIFGNLITNAINYTKEGGKIRVDVDLAGINIRVKVIDNGFGIPEKRLEKIFERFYRVKDEKTRYITGTGLGLPIVKELVDSLNGFIDVDSTPGRGTVFTVLLPAKY